VPREEAKGFGVIDADAEGKVRGFLEKPADPPSLPDSPEESFASMGNYVFSTETLLEALRADAADESSAHDMGGSIMPMLAEQGEAWVYDFSTNVVPGATERDHGYWRDVGTIDSYFDAHMDLVSVTPIFNLYNDRWPILSLPPQQPPAKFVLGGRAEESMVCAGAIIGGGSVHHSVVSGGVRVERGARVEDSVLMDGVHIGEGAYVRRAILDKNVVVPAWARIGVDHDLDKQHYDVSAGGVVVLGKGARAIV
jgi:glucose-1-phosphate adenylyltransferase